MRIEVDVAVVGGGAAGIAAAKAAAAAGAKTLLLEREKRLGGVLDQCIHPGFGLHRYREELTGPEFAHRLLQELEISGAQVLTEATVLGVSEEPELRVGSPRGLFRVRARAVVWAVGARERPFGPLLIPGPRPAGIFTAGLAQKLVNIYGVLPGKRALILGSGDIGLIMARRLSLEGLGVVGVAEIKPFPGGLLRNVVQCLEDFAIPLLLRHTVAQVHGRKRLTGVTLVEVDEGGRPLAGTEKFVEVDTLVLSVGLIPELRLLAPFLPREQLQRGVVVNSFFQAQVPWLFLAGNALVVFDLVDTVAKTGEEAGRNAALFACGELPPAPHVPAQRGANVAALVPQRIVPGKPVTLYLRVPRPLARARIRVAGVYEKKCAGLRPAEMVEVSLPAEVTLGLSALLVEVIPD
ncbi:MAG: NAD(P)/FAD-dependent oxidoreductase [Candidatus Bipolaricaulaceae bacterium]